MTATHASTGAFVRDATRAWDDGRAAMLAIVDATSDAFVGGFGVARALGFTPDGSERVDVVATSPRSLMRYRLARAS